MTGTQLKDPRLVRIFMSSPFNGMEMERNILSKFYWPKIESALSEKGLHLKVVDMRWGISSLASSESDTINICLREIGRSDIFVGLFAQRYGWWGLEDKEYQENLQKAAKKFPWVENHRDKSVTELEFLHGHLNEPGVTPACFCFRDKVFDQKMWLKARGNPKKQRHYIVENAESDTKLNDLKERVEKTAAKTIGLLVEYSTPDEGAEFINTSVWGHIQNKIISQIVKPMDAFEDISFAHKSYQAYNVGMQIGALKYIESIEKYVNSDSEGYRPLTIIGPTGCGRTTLVCNWLKDNEKLQKNIENQFCHFVGAEPTSTSIRNLMERILCFLHSIQTGDSYKIDNKSTLSNMAKEIQKYMCEMQTPEHKDKRLIFVINNIENLKEEKAKLPLFWLPKDLPTNVKVILSLSQDAEGLIKILTEEHKAEQIVMQQLSESDKKLVCAKLLEENSKSMDADQVKMIIASEKTNNLFFLRTLINELCVSGRFRRLTNQIKDLLQSDGVQGLLVKVLERIKQDYDAIEPDKNVVEQVLCALCLCKQGIIGAEIPMPSELWGPVVYALDTFLIENGQLLEFASHEMKKAVELLFLSTPEKKTEIAKKMSKIFYRQYNLSLRTKEKVKLRTVTELLHLLRLGEERDEFAKVLGDINVFKVIREASPYDLNDYWQWLGTPAETIARLYLDSINMSIREECAIHWNDAEDDFCRDAMEKKSVLISSIREWFEESKMFQGLPLLFNKEMEMDSTRPGLSDLQREKIMCGLKYQKACFLSDTENYEEALKLHQEVLGSRRKLKEADMMSQEELEISCNELGLCYYNLKCYDEAESMFNMVLEFGKGKKQGAKTATTHCNLGLISLGKKLVYEALERFNKSLAIREEAEPNVISLEYAYIYNNLGLAYRNKADFEMAEKYYSKSLKMKENLLGRNSFDVAMSIMNLGTLEVYRGNHQKALEYAQEALRIFEEVTAEGSSFIMMAKENVANQLTILNRYEEAEKYFKEVLSARGLPGLHRSFIKWYISKGRVEEAANIAFELVSWTNAPGDIVLLAWADKHIPPARRPERPEFATVDYGYRKWPTFKTLLRFKMGDVLEETPHKFKIFVFRHCEEGPASEVIQRYVQIALILKEEMKEFARAVEVVDIAVKTHPGNKMLQYIFKVVKSM